MAKVATNQERLNELFDRDARSDTSIAKELHISKQLLSAWRKGTRSPKTPMLLKLTEMYNVSIDWLMGYDVPDYSEDDLILSAYHRADEGTKTAVRKLLDIPDTKKDTASSAG